MSSFFKEIYFFDSETEIEFFYIDTIVKKSKIENSLNLVIESTVKSAKSKLWKDVRSKKVFSEYPYELNLTYIQNLKELRNFKLISSALQTLEKEPAERSADQRGEGERMRAVLHGAAAAAARGRGRRILCGRQPPQPGRI